MELLGEPSWAWPQYRRVGPTAPLVYGCVCLQVKSLIWAIKQLLMAKLHLWDVHEKLFRVFPSNSIGCCLNVFCSSADVKKSFQVKP